MRITKIASILESKEYTIRDRRIAGSCQQIGLHGVTASGKNVTASFPLALFPTVPARGMMFGLF